MAYPVDGNIENVVQDVAESDGERKGDHIRSEKCGRNIPPGNRIADNKREKGDEDVPRARHFDNGTHFTLSRF